MKIRGLNILMGLVIILIACQSCEKEENETKISSFNDTESHKMGENCMNCHTSGGDGEGWFTVAGTVYDSSQTAIFPNASIKLYTAANAGGDLMATIQVDQNGNFYTTEAIDFGNGLYTFVEGNFSNKHMNSAVVSGTCNSCHGGSIDPIWAK